MTRNRRVLLAGTGTFLRNLDVLLLGAVLNAVVQALLVWAVPVERARPPALWVGTTVSVLVWLTTLSAFAATGVAGRGRHLGVALAASTTSHVLVRTMLWSAVVAAALAVSLAVFTWLALVVAFGLACVPVAAAASPRVPFPGALRAVTHHVGRMLLLGLVVAAIWLPLGVFVGLWSLLLPTPLAPFLVVGVEGILLAWLMACLAAIYTAGRDATAAAPSGDVEPEPPTPQELAV
ncbi:MAG: hypothetical protein IT198_09935 [Acidimicrobiia bacterium]|nr:hypothetical protein [Acidimicrobiia bacterium]